MFLKIKTFWRTLNWRLRNFLKHLWGPLLLLEDMFQLFADQEIWSKSHNWKVRNPHGWPYYGILVHIPTIYRKSYLFFPCILYTKLKYYGETWNYLFFKLPNHCLCPSAVLICQFVINDLSSFAFTKHLITCASR